MTRVGSRYGLAAATTYGVLSLVELPFLFGAVHYSGTEWMLDLELRTRKAMGLPSEKADAYLYKAQGAELAAQLGAVFILHKLLMVVRIPVTAALTPAVAKRLSHNGLSRRPPARTNGYAAGASESDSTEINPKALHNMGTPPSKRNKWFSWFF